MSFCASTNSDSLCSDDPSVMIMGGTSPATPRKQVSLSNIAAKLVLTFATICVPASCTLYVV